MLTGLAVATLLAQAVGAGAEPLAEEALSACKAAVAAPGVVHEELLERGLHLAEAALARDEADARAHLAEFCNLGRLTEARGLGFAAMSAVRRLRRTIDDATRLAPDDPEILAARGAFLVELPRLLGGDPVTGEALLRRAVALAPSNCDVASRLAQVLVQRGVADEAAALRDHCR
ncbi:MAG TPA: hypothetical protein VGR62_21265 [Candidatus Binatia bacterium]|nr:hypothetical protein [Candidatus Binatia bacterium]